MMRTGALIRLFRGVLEKICVFRVSPPAIAPRRVFRPVWERFLRPKVSA